MERTHVNSGALTTVAYDEHAQILYATFRDNSSYSYHMVPSAVHRALLASPSIGSYFNGFIKHRYHATKVG